MMNEVFKKLSNEAGLYVDFKGEPWPKWLGAENADKAYHTFFSLVIDECKQTLVNHGYTDAAQCLEKEYAEDWQKLEFPEI